MTSTENLDVSKTLERYKQERDRRMRSDGNNQYIRPVGALAHFLTEDPYAPQRAERAPLNDQVEVAIIGAGFAGMLAAARLQEQGVTDIRIIDRAADFGGTWYWNRYPGVQCDIESYCYLPLLEELQYEPKEKYSYGGEIFEHCRRIGRAYGLYNAALFQTAVTSVEWKDQEQRWLIQTDRGDALSARFLIMAVGSVSVPKLPAVKGIESFKGHSFHSSRWDYDYTGGDLNGNLDKLHDKRIAIIGTGATAIQLIPHVGATAKELYVFQRTPSSVDERGNRATDPDWYNSQPKGWQRARRENFNQLMMGFPVEKDLVEDGWTEIGRQMNATRVEGESFEDFTKRAQLIDIQKMDELRRRVTSIVSDPATAEGLKAWYSRLCKRPCFNDGYLPTFNRPNVSLVDVSATKGVEEITETGIAANGKLYQVDCIIFASGFEVTSSIQRRFSFPVIGRNGVTLNDHWASGYRTLHGLTSHNFPNWFFMGISQNALSPNFTSMYDDQAQHIAYIIKTVRERGSAFETTTEAEDSWIAEIRAFSKHQKGFFEGCTPGYYNNEGDEGIALWDELYALGVNAFNAKLADWRQSGELPGINVR